jgi:hypothetical protein
VRSALYRRIRLTLTFFADIPVHGRTLPHEQIVIAAVVTVLSATSMWAQTATISGCPVLDAGVPALANIGYGVYWSIKRRRSAN